MIGLSDKQLNFYRFLAVKLSDDDLYPHYSYGEEFTLEQVRNFWRKTAKAILSKKAPQKLGLYIHIPFCRQKYFFCFCDSYIPSSYKVVEEYLGLLRKEIDAFRDIFRPLSFTSVYFGGGSPSFLKTGDLENLFRYLHQSFKISPDAQIIFESTPVDLGRDNLSVLARYGVNRLTIGVQSLDPKVIRLIRRPQSKEDFKFFPVFVASFFCNLLFIIGLRQNFVHRIKFHFFEPRGVIARAQSARSNLKAQGDCFVGKRVIAGLLAMTNIASLRQSKYHQYCYKHGKASDFIRTFRLARKLGIPYINIDLIAGLEGQSVQSFISDLKTALELKADMIHVTGFTPFAHTPFCRAGKRLSPDQERNRKAMLSISQEMLKKAFIEIDDENAGSSEKAENVQETDLRKENSSLLGVGHSAQSHAFGQVWYEHPPLATAKHKPDYKQLPIFRGVRGSLDEEMRKFVFSNLQRGFSRKFFYQLFKKDAVKILKEEMSVLAKLGKLRIEDERIVST